MRISFSALNRFVEDKIAIDEAYRETLLRKGKVTLASGRALADQALLDKLASLGLRLDRDEFIRRTGAYLSGQAMSEAVYADPNHPLRESDMDWVWIAFTCLWERWCPQRPSLEMIDDLMQDGYKTQARRDEAATCRLWLGAWKGIWAIVEAKQLRSVKEFDALFSGTNSLFNWVQDLLRELHRAGFRDRTFHQERLAVLEALLGKFDLGSLLPGCKNDLGETYFALGMPEKAEQLYRQWLEEMPTWGWGWIGWADGYTWKNRDEEPDLARAQAILERGLAIPNVEDRRHLLDRLHHLYKETGRPEKAQAIREEVERLERPAAASREAPAPPLQQVNRERRACRASEARRGSNSPSV